MLLGSGQVYTANTVPHLVSSHCSSGGQEKGCELQPSGKTYRPSRNSRPFAVQLRHFIMYVAMSSCWRTTIAPEPPSSRKWFDHRRIVLNSVTGLLAHLQTAFLMRWQAIPPKLAPPIKTSSPSGKTPTPTFPSRKKPRRSTKS